MRRSLLTLWKAVWKMICKATRKVTKAVSWFLEKEWCPEPESNQRHADFQSAALPTELSGQPVGRRAFSGSGCLCPRGPLHRVCHYPLLEQELHKNR